MCTDFPVRLFFMFVESDPNTGLLLNISYVCHEEMWYICVWYHVVHIIYCKQIFTITEMYFLSYLIEKMRICCAFLLYWAGSGKIDMSRVTFLYICKETHFSFYMYMYMDPVGFSGISFRFAEYRVTVFVLLVASVRPRDEYVRQWFELPWLVPNQYLNNGTITKNLKWHSHNI